MAIDLEAGLEAFDKLHSYIKERGIRIHERAWLLRDGDSIVGAEVSTNYEALIWDKYTVFHRPDKEGVGWMGRLDFRGPGEPTTMLYALCAKAKAVMNSLHPQTLYVDPDDPSVAHIKFNRELSLSDIKRLTEFMGEWH